VFDTEREQAISSQIVMRLENGRFDVSNCNPKNNNSLRSQIVTLKDDQNLKSQIVISSFQKGHYNDL